MDNTECHQTVMWNSSLEKSKKKQLYRARKDVHYFKMADSDPGNDSCIWAKQKSKPRGDLHQEEKKTERMHK